MYVTNNNAYGIILERSMIVGLGLGIGAAASALVGGPIGVVGGALYGLGETIGILVTDITTTMCCSSCQNNKEGSSVMSAAKVAKIIITIIASIAAGWCLLAAAGITASLGSVVVLHLAMIGVGIAATVAILAAVIIPIWCFCPPGYLPRIG